MSKKPPQEPEVYPTIPLDGTPLHRRPSYRMAWCMACDRETSHKTDPIANAHFCTELHPGAPREETKQEPQGPECREAASLQPPEKLPHNRAHKLHAALRRKHQREEPWESLAPPVPYLPGGGPNFRCALPAPAVDVRSLPFSVRGPQQPDEVESPPHYVRDGIELRDVVRAWELGHYDGSAVKYILRAKHKGARRQDLLKAIQSLKLELDSL